MTVRIVSWFDLAERCGRHAAGCYSRREGNRGVMVVPAGRSSSIAHTVVHEYGHHVDASRRHSGLDEPNGTPLWWKARGMAQLVAVAERPRPLRGRLGPLDREVFAEDYAYTNLHRRYQIAWLEPPSASVQQAILADLGLAERPDLASTRPALRPVVIVRQGTLQPNTRVTVGFGLLGPNRRIRLDGRLGDAAGARGNVSVTCGDRLHSKALAATAAVARGAARRARSVSRVAHERRLAVGALPLHGSPDDQLNERRSRTNSASSMSGALRLNSSASRQA